ncbi:hypothetical protein HMN09_01180800 [Mycena chlorophos]|uniref:Uncharacterized protein n=1 Tax=Mycena chlorophos TaxID=658473 RepID=A0A8H6S6R8_MYCCL|nr:hypothetical protein HMN09_01180800 [Mycena chlorophos]
MATPTPPNDLIVLDATTLSALTTATQALDDARTALARMQQPSLRTAVVPATDATALQDEIVRLRTVLANAGKETEERQSELAGLREELARARDEASRLRAELAGAQDAVSSLRAQLAVRDEGLERGRAELDEGREALRREREVFREERRRQESLLLEQRESIAESLKRMGAAMEISRDWPTADYVISEADSKPLTDPFAHSSASPTLAPRESPHYCPDSPLAYIIQPSSTHAQRGASSPEPQVIFIFAWMGAPLNQLKGISKIHAALHPNAVQFIVLSDMDSITGSRGYNLERLRPVAAFIRSHAFREDRAPSAVFQVFSGGGAAQLVWLSSLFNSESTLQVPASSRACSPAVLILDSTPGSFYRGDYVTATLLSRPSLAQSSRARTALTALGLSARWAVMSAWWRLPGRQSTHTFIREGLNDPALLRWINPAGDVPRVYIYSDTDEVTRMAHVLQHASEAKKAGVSDGERYRAILAREWRDAAGGIRAKL